jgi:hypothetical protein
LLLRSSLECVRELTFDRRYNPLFMNDAAPYQDVYTSYGSTNLARLKAAKKTYDPTGFFTNRQGGFKLPA